MYCNTAQHNARTILNTIADKISLVKKDTNDTTSEENLHQSKVISELNDKNKTIQHSSIIDLLERNLPFAIIQIKKEEPKKISERLTAYLKALDALRNFYSHYSPEKSFTETLEKVSALKEAKTLLNQDLSVIKRHALTVVEKRFPLEKEAGIYIKESAQDFISRNQSKQYDDFKYSFKKTNKKLNEDDFLFFLSLFLTRKETEELLNHIRGKKSTVELYHQQIRHFFTALNAKKFQSKLVSTNPRQALILNLINQLGHLPRHLEPYLNKKAQEGLLIKEESTADIKENSPRLIKKLRHNDIFAHHALQLLEYTGLIPNIQFQINLGKVYLRAPYNKIINGREVKRELDKNLLAMGHLKDFDYSFYKDHIKKEEDKEPEFRKPLKYYRPKYHFAQNRIGISFLKKEKKEKKEKKDSEKEKLSLKNFEETEHWQFNHHNTLPQFILSHKVLPFMIYLELKAKQKGKISFVEIMLNKYKSNFRKFLSAVVEENLLGNEDLLNDPEKYLQEKYHLKKQWLPTIIKKHIFRHELIDKKKVALSKIDQMLEKTKFLLECDGKSIEKRKEYNGFFHFSFKKGDRATWIAKDIVKLMNAEERIKNGNQVIYKKLNPGEYNLLQSILAYFTKNKEEIESFYKRFKIKERHPFLKYVKSDGVMVKGTKRDIGIKKYFKRYLEKREYWLEGLKESLMQGTLSADADEFSFIDFYKIRFNKAEELKKYAKNLLKKNEEKDFIHPMYVPNDLFNDEIKKWTVIEKPSATRMIAEDTKAIGNQWFYKEQNHKNVNRKNEKEQEERKKQFRYERMKDAILWMMIQKNIEDEEDVTLKNALQSLTLNNYKLPGTTEKDNIFDIEVEIGIDIPIPKNGAIKVKGKRKLKDYGAYRHFLKDKRIPHLLYYYEKMGSSSIEIDTIEEELQYLDVHSIETLKKIFDFEKQLIGKDEKLYEEVLETELKYDNGRIKKEKGIPKFSLHLCKYQKKYPNTFSEQDIKDIYEIRNKLLHNQVPQLDFDLKPDELVCKQLFDKIDGSLQKAVNTL